MWYCKKCNLLVNDKLKTCPTCLSTATKYPGNAFTCTCTERSIERPNNTRRIYVLQNSNDQLDFEFVPCNLIILMGKSNLCMLYTSERSSKSNLRTYLKADIDFDFDSGKYITNGSDDEKDDDSDNCRDNSRDDKFNTSK